MAELNAETMNINDIYEMNVKYKEYMSEYYSKQSITGPWTEKWIECIKNMMITNNTTLHKTMRHVYKKIVENKYIIDDKNDKTLRRVMPNDTSRTLLVVPSEKAFDIIWKMHLKCNHGSLTETFNLIKNDFYIDLHCVYYITQNCPICKEKNLSTNTAAEPMFNKRATIEVFNFSFMADGQYKFLLTYVDEVTGLVQLRPLKDRSDSEMTQKLMNIFSDLGLPNKLTVYEPYEYVGIFDLLNILFKAHTINFDCSILYNSKEEYIKNQILEWMKNENSSYWRIGCYAVQWKINNSIVDGKISQHLVFGPKEKAGGLLEPYRPSAADNDSPNPEIMLFEEQSRIKPYTQPKETLKMGKHISEQALANPTENNIEASGIHGRKPIKSYKAPNILRRSYVNKKALMSQQNLTIEKEPNSKIIVKIESTDQYLENDSLNMDEYEEVPIKQEASNDCIICFICQTEITYQSYKCMKCRSEIHLECGELVLSDGIEDEIICFSCELEAKKKKIG